MELDEETLTRELTYFAKGPAALGQSPWTRLKKLHQLRQAFEVPEDHFLPGALRRRLRAGVRSLLRHGSDDHRRVMEVVMGLDRSIQHANLMARLEVVAAELGHGVPKIRQLKDEAITQCARTAVANSHKKGSVEDLGYLVPELVSRFLVDLDHRQPTELIEQRKIMSEKAPLNVIAAQHGILPPSPGKETDEFEAEVLEGGDFLRVRRWPGDTIEHRIRPPYPLSRGEVHAYSFRYRFSPAQPFDDRFRLQPLAPHLLYETVDLAVEFLGDRRPSRIWKLDGATPRATLGDPNVVELSLNESELVRAAFHDPLPGRVYGIGWSVD